MSEKAIEKVVKNATTPSNLPAVYAGMKHVMEKIGALEKNLQTNYGDRYSYRGIDDLLNRGHVVFGQANLAVVPEVQPEYIDKEVSTKKGTARLLVVWVKFRLTSLIDGSTCVIGPVPGECIESSDKGYNKAMAAALKIALYQTFMVPVSDLEDTEKHDPQLDKAQATATVTQSPTEPVATRTPAVRQPIAEDDDRKHRKELVAIAMEMTQGKIEAAQDLVEIWSSFIGKEGNEVQGFRDTLRLKGVRLAITLETARKAHAAFKASQDAGLQEGVPDEADDSTPF